MLTSQIEMLMGMTLLWCLISSFPLTEYYKEKEKVIDKNRFKSIHFTKNEEGDFICLEGYAFELGKETIDERREYERNNKYYVIWHCDGCRLRRKCTKAKNGKWMRK